MGRRGSAAAEYLAERIPDLQTDLADDRRHWLDQIAETISPTEIPSDDDVEVVSAVMALQHADWLGLAIGVVRRGPGGALDDVDGEIEDRDGHLAILRLALVHLTPLWQDLGVLEEREHVTEQGVWGVPRALYRLLTAAP